MTLLNNLKANVATIASMLLITVSGAFWVGTVTAQLKSDVETIKEKQVDYDMTQRSLMTLVNNMAINIERVAMKLGVETK